MPVIRRYIHAVLDGIRYMDTKTVVEHTYISAAQWQYDPISHWKQCTGCEEKLEVASHTPGPAATENASQKCTICGYILRAPLGLDWFTDGIQDPNCYFWASGYNAKIMEQYGDYLGNTPQ